MSCVRKRKREKEREKEREGGRLVSLLKRSTTVQRTTTSLSDLLSVDKFLNDFQSFLHFQPPAHLKLKAHVCTPEIHVHVTILRVCSLESH